MNPQVFKRAFIAPLAVALLSTVLTWSAMAQGLDPRKSITQYNHDVWQAEDGLPQNSVAAIVQTHDGYIWLGTQEGLVRFDGVRFTVFDKKNTKEIEHSDIRALCEDRDGSLWIGTGGGGLARMRDGKFTAYTTADGLSGNIVRSLCEDRDGSLWIGTDGDGLSRLKDGKFTTYTTKEGLSGGRVVSLCEDRSGCLWIGTDGGGLSRLKDDKFTNYSTKEGLPVNMVWAICESRDGSLWIGTYGGGLLRMKDGGLVSYTTKEGLSHDIVVSVCEDREGTLWIGTAGGLNRLRDGRFSAYTAKEGLSNDRVVSICEDREGSLWVGTDGGGLDRLGEGKFTPFTTKEGLSDNFTWTVYGSRDGSVWIGTGGGGLSQMKDGKCSTYTTKEGLSYDAVRSIYEDRQGALWIGTYGGGLDRLEEGKFTVYTTKEGLSNDMVRAICEDREGNLWIGTNGGLNRFREGKFTIYTSQNGLPHDVVRVIYEGKDGSLWIGTNDGLCRLKDRKFSTYTTKDGLSSDYIFAVHESADGTIWVGTNGGGLDRLSSDSLEKGNRKFVSYTTKDGLFDDLVFQILEDEQSNLWMSCNKGIFCVSRKELDDYAQGRINSITSISYDVAEGIRGRECNGGSQPAGWRTMDGRLWFPTGKGVVMIDPRNIKTNKLPPPVVIERVNVDKNFVDPNRRAELPPGEAELEFQYSALSFVGAEKIRFRYKLEGFDKEWINAGTRRVAYYTNIPAGDYRFRVMACNSDGIWNETGASYEFHLTPHFYQTRLFYALCILLLLLMATGAYYLRFRQLVRHAQKLRIGIAERTAELVEVNRSLQSEITERKQAEKKYATIIQSALDGFWISDSKGRILDVNDSYCRMLGYTREELLGMSIPDVEASEKPEETAQHVKKIFEQGYGRFTTRHRRKDGKILDVEISANRLDGGEGQLVVFIRDITERKRAEEALAKQHNMLRTLIDALPYLIFVKDTESRFVTCNTTTLQNFGLTKLDEIVGKTDFDFSPHDVAAPFYAEEQAIIQSGQAVHQEGVHVSRKTRKGMWTMSTKVPLRDTHGKIVGLVGIVRDITELRRKEESLRESEERFRALSEATFEGIGFSENGIILDVNPQLAGILGYEPGEVTGKPVHELVLPEDRELVVQKMSAEYELPYEHRMVRKDGSTIIVEARGKSFPYQGRMVRMTAIRDITERKRVEEALRASEARYRTLAEAAHDSIFIINRDGYFEYINGFAARQFGLQPEEIIGKPVALLFPPEMLKDRQQNLQTVFESGQPLYVEYQRSLHDAREVWLGIRLVPILDATGAVRAVLGISREITERKRTEQALKESEGRSRSIIENCRDGIIFFDGNTRKILLGNGAMAELLGCSKEDLVGRSISSLHPPEEWESVEKEFQKHVNGELSVSTGIPVVRNDGSVFYADISSSPITLDGRSYFSAFFRDVTERKHTEETLQRERNLLRTLIDNLPDLIYVKDIECHKIIANLADVRNMGCQSEAEVLGKTDFDCYPAEVAQAFYSDDRLVIQTGQPVLNREEYSFDDKGQKRWLLTSKLPLRDEQGRIVGLVGVGREITEQKRAEEALKHEKALMDALMDNIPDSIYFKDRQCRLVRISRKMMQSLNVDEVSKVIGKTDLDLYGEEFGRRTLADDQHLMTSGDPIVGLIESRQLEDGQKNWTLTTKVPLRDESGQIVGLVGITREINELMRAQEERERERNLLRTLIDNLPDLIYVKDTECRKIIANLADVRNTGRQSEAEVLGKTDFDCYPAEVAEAFYSDDRSVMGTGQPVLSRQEYSLDERGEKRWLLTSKFPLRGQKGEIIGLVGIGRDITEQRCAEEALEKERNLLRAVIDNIPDLFYFKDAEGRYVLNNRAHLRSMGVECQESVLGKTTFDFHPSELANQYYEDEMRIVRTGEALLEREELALHKDTDEQRWHLTSKIPLRDGQGKVTGIVGISRDITERKRAEERQAQLMKEVEHANQELNDFAYIISHDLKAPLRAIGSLTNWLSADFADKFDQEGKELIQLLFGRVKRMHDLIDGILQYSRVGRMKEESVLVDLDELVLGVIDMLAPPSNILISVENDLPTIMCEKTRMQQVFQNLLSNAVKFMDKPNGEVRIGCERVDGYWKFRVADNGPGIEDKHFTKIFQIFQTLSPRDEFESTGIGLTVVKKIIETYGGRIWVESKVGDGSTFYFTLPTQEA